MAGRQSAETPQWLIPVLLIAGAFVAALIVLGIWAANQDDGSEDATLVEQLESYTACLNDHGANVPLVETRSDGGFAIIVPGSLVDGDVDLERWRAARQACRDLEPNPLELLFGGSEFDMLLPLIEGGFRGDR